MVARPLPSSPSNSNDVDLPSTFASLDLDSAAPSAQLDLASGARTILVLGGSYGGLRAARMVADELTPEEIKEGWHVVLVERNSHFNHLYLFPRVTVLTDLTERAFIPMAHLLKRPHIFLQSTLVGLSPTHASLLLASSPTPISLPFKFCVYALGGSLPPPIDLSQSATCSKVEGVERLRRVRQRVEQVGPDGRVCIIGGGALGIQMATDIKEVFPDRQVTLLHSRLQLLPAFSKDLHDAAIERLTALKIKVVLGERAVLPPQGYGGELSTHAKVVCTVTGRLIPCDLILTCTGQIPLSQHLIPSFPTSINPSTKRIHVLPTTQIASGPDLSEPIEEGRFFAVGDCCETEAIMAGYTAWNQAGIAGANVLSLIRSSSSSTASSPPPALEHYEPDSPAIKLTLGLKDYAVQTTEGAIKRGTDGKADLGVDIQWTFLGNTTEDYSL